MTLPLVHAKYCDLPKGTVLYKDDTTKAGAVSYWILMFLFIPFCAYSCYATHEVLIKKHSQEELN